jgi:small subunit ribosomal protein S16
MLKIRLKLVGRKKKPFYKISVMESLSKRDGKHIVELGYYNPIIKKVKINNSLLCKYIRTGAYPSNVVRHLICNLLTEKVNK